jgi:hypothetical protein
MGIYQDEVLRLEEAVKANIENLNSIADRANSTTNRELFQRLKNQYDSEKAVYDSNVAKYNEAAERYGRYRTVKSVSTVLVDVPSVKDRNENLAGGYFGLFAGLAGSPLYSSTAMPNMRIGKPFADKTAFMLDGSMLTFLDWGFGEIMNMMQAGQLDLLFDEDIPETRVIRITVEVTDRFGNIRTIYRDINLSDGDSSSTSISVNGQTASLSELNDTMNSRMDAAEQTVAGIAAFSGLGPIGSVISVAAYDIATGQAVRAGQLIGRTAINQAINVFSSQITRGITNSFNITSITQTMAIGFVVTEVLTEAFEVLTGLDNNFGFGGELVGFDDQGNGLYSAPSSFTQVASDTLAEIAGFFTGVNPNTATYNPDIVNTPVTNQAGNTVGFQTTSGVFTGLNGARGTGLTDFYGNTVSDISGAINTVTRGTLSDAIGAFGRDSAGSVSAIGNTNTNNGLGAGLEGINTGGLTSIGDRAGPPGTVNEGADNSKIVCTAMNNKYGFGSFRNKIWLAYARKNLTKFHEIGYHTIFIPLVYIAYNNNTRWLQTVLEHVARHRTIDIRAELSGNKRDTIGRIERFFLEPLCYAVGRIKHLFN